MFGLIRKAIRQDNQGQKPSASLPVTPPSEQAMDEEIPRYPPFMKGLPGTHPDKLIETQRELIGQIREAGLASSEIFEQFYRQSLRRFASYAHLLPASQTHHHRGAGGLLRHAAEVALWSLQSGDRVLLPGEQAPRPRLDVDPKQRALRVVAAHAHGHHELARVHHAADHLVARQTDPGQGDAAAHAAGGEVVDGMARITGRAIGAAAVALRKLVHAQGQ